MIVTVLSRDLQVTSVPHKKKKYRVHLKQNDEDDYHLVSAHYIRVSGEAGGGRGEVDKEERKEEVKIKRMGRRRRGE